MPKLGEQINNDLKQAMRGKEEKILAALRMLLSALKNKEISLRDGKNKELTDEQIIGVIKSEVKKRRDSIEAYQQGKREDLAKREEEEITVLQKYLPEELSPEKIEKIVREVIGSQKGASAANFGQIMGQAMAKLKGKADGNQVGAIVKKILAG